jgi:UDP-glucose 4-epimerase
VQQPAPIIHEHSEPRRPSRVIVLGASGFLGRSLLQRLSRGGVETVPVSSRELNLSSAGAAADLAALLKPTDSVVFLAATKLGLRLDDDGFVENVAMGAAFCNAVRKAGCSHVVYLSSDAVYPFSNSAIREDSATAPTYLYALMHLARETMLRNLDGPPVAILRATQVYGAGDPHGAYGPRRMVRSALTEGRIVLYGAGQETRDHIHLADVTAVMTEALARRSRGLVNVATGRSISFASLADLVARACGEPIAIESVPPRMPVMHRTFDTTALQAAFPDCVKTTLEQGIASMIEEERQAASRPSLRIDAAGEAGPDYNGSGKSLPADEPRTGRPGTPLARPLRGRGGPR